MQRTQVRVVLMFSVIASIGVSVPSLAQDVIINGSFEDPRITPGVPDNWVADASLLPGWSTTASDNTVELWTDGFLDPDPSYYELHAYEGDQFVVLNADEGRDLYQDVTGIASGSVLGFVFADRRFRPGGFMRVTITDLGGDGSLGGGDDTVLFVKDFIQGTVQWRLQSDAGEPPIVSIGNTIRISFRSTHGLRLLDSVTFGTGLPVELLSFTITQSTLSEDESIQTE